MQRPEGQTREAPRANRLDKVTTSKNGTLPMGKCHGFDHMQWPGGLRGRRPGPISNTAHTTNDDPALPSDQSINFGPRI